MMQDGNRSEATPFMEKSGDQAGTLIMLEPSAETMRWADGHAPGISADMGVVTGTFIVALIAAVSVRRWRISDAARHGGAFRRLARRSGIHGRDRRLLQRLCRAAGLETGGGVFFSVGCFDHVAQHAPPGGRGGQRLADVREKLFPGS